jgi:hypothetical protein
MYTFEQLKEDVRKEAEALKIHATKEELSKLDIASFDANCNDTCIYGLIARTCTTARAHELISKCCKVLIENGRFLPRSKGVDSIRLAPMVDSETLNEARTIGGGMTNLKYLSTIEAYIMLPEANNANLIAFLRGETESLEL